MHQAPGPQQCLCPSHWHLPACLPACMYVVWICAVCNNQKKKSAEERINWHIRICRLSMMMMLTSNCTRSKATTVTCELPMNEWYLNEITAWLVFIIHSLHLFFSDPICLHLSFDHFQIQSFLIKLSGEKKTNDASKSNLSVLASVEYDGTSQYVNCLTDDSDSGLRHYFLPERTCSLYKMWLGFPFTQVLISSQDRQLKALIYGNTTILLCGTILPLRTAEVSHTRWHVSEDESKINMVVNWSWACACACACALNSLESVL